MASINVVSSALLSPGEHVYPTTGFYTGMDDATDIEMTGAAATNVHIEVDRYEAGEFQETLTELTFDGVGVVYSELRGRAGDGTPVAIFPAATGLKVRITPVTLGLTTVSLTTQP